MTGLSSPSVPGAQRMPDHLADMHIDLQPSQSPGLPEGVWRDHCIELIITVYRRELTPADERVLRHYARCTRPRDWTSPGQGPVCYAGQLNTAEALHLDRKSVYNAECKLERLGLVAKITLANGHRRGPRGTRHVSAPLGLAFYPAIAAYESLEEKAEAARNAAEAFERVRRTLMAVRGTLASLLRTCPLQDNTVTVIRDAFTELPKRLSRLTDIKRIEELTAAFQDLLDDLRTHISDQKTSTAGDYENQQMTPKIPHEWESHSPSHIYTTTEAISVDGTSHEDLQTGARAPETYISKPAYAGKGLRNKNVADPLPVNTREAVNDNLPAPVNWQIRDLINAAGPEFQTYLSLFESNPARIASHHIVDAAGELAGAIGINQSAWVEACSELGQFDAALAVLILDANRDHPERPVQKPGGALRGMVRKHRVGALNLDASMFALLRRRANADLAA